MKSRYLRTAVQDMMQATVISGADLRPAQDPKALVKKRLRKNKS